MPRQFRSPSVKQDAAVHTSPPHRTLQLLPLPAAAVTAATHPAAKRSSRCVRRGSPRGIPRASSSPLAVGFLLLLNLPSTGMKWRQVEEAFRNRWCCSFQSIQEDIFFHQTSIVCHHSIRPME